MRTLTYTCLFFILILFGSCRKEGITNYATPKISIVDISATTVQQFEETVTVTIAYEDGDGDLGDPHPDTLSLYVHDSRLKDPDRYHVPPLAPPDHTLTIKGEIDVTLLSPFLLGNGSFETVNYALKIRDRAGNWSNEVTTETITIKK